MPRYTSPLRIDEKQAIKTLSAHAIHLQSKADLQPLFNMIGDARIVMLGEASHGTHEYYTWRTYITKKLIEEKGFNFIAVEGDWPDCYRVNRFIKGYENEASTALQVLQGFNRWPTWMWANWEIVALTDWLKSYNEGRSEEKVGFYGLDVYSLWESLDSVLKYLEKTDCNALKVAEDAFRCFEPYREEEGSSYARATQFVPDLCTNEVVNLLAEIRRRKPDFESDEENVFNAEQNALITVNAEKYYRAMIQGGASSWNVRDRHMGDTLKRLLSFHRETSKVVVWEHNTHVGDARATDMAEEGMMNIGELARVEHQDKGVVLIGFGSYKGSVIAGKRWGAKMQSMHVPEGKRGSWEYLMHNCGPGNKLLLMPDLANKPMFLENHIDHRAIGVVYNPEFEQYGNYVPSILPQRYDAFIHIDETRALYPLHIEAVGHLMPETYPFGV